jgi:hypothetical protein
MMFGIEVRLDFLGAIRKPRAGLTMWLEDKLPNEHESYQNEEKAAQNKCADAQRDD